MDVFFLSSGHVHANSICFFQSCRTQLMGAMGSRPTSRTRRRGPHQDQLLDSIKAPQVFSPQRDTFGEREGSICCNGGHGIAFKRP